MKWFEHDAQLRKSDCFEQMNELFGEPLGYSFGLLIWEAVAQHGGDDFRMKLCNAKTNGFTLEWWARLFGGAAHPTPRALAAKILMNAAACGVIDNEALLKDGVVYAPKLREHLDEWAKKKAKRNASAVSAGVRKSDAED
jgi:hypothetical protein